MKSKNLSKINYRTLIIIWILISIFLYFSTPLKECLAVGKISESEQDNAEGVTPLFKRISEGLNKTLLDLNEGNHIASDLEYRIPAMKLLSKDQLDANGWEKANQAWAYSQEWRYGEAIDECKQLLKHYPKALFVHYILAITYINAGKINLASQEYQLLKKELPSMIEVRILGSIIDIRKGDFAESEKKLQKILEEFPGEDEIFYYYLGVSNFLRKNFEQATISFSHAIEINPELYDAYLSLAISLLLQNKKEGAVNELKKVLEKKPNFLKARSVLIGLYFSVSDIDNAEKTCQEWIELFPKDIIPHLLIVLFFGDSNADKAITHADAIIKIRPDYKPIYSLLSNLYILRGDYDNAIKYAQEVIRMNQEKAYGYHLLGSIYDSKDDFDNAELYYSKAIEKDPLDADIYVDLGCVYLVKNSLTDAERCYKKSIELDSVNKQAYYFLGVIYRKSKRYPEAQKNYESAIQIDPNYTLAYSSLGFLYNLMGDNDKALANLEKALQLGDHLDTIYNHLGIVYGSKKDYEKAIEYYKKSIEVVDEDGYVKSRARSNLAGVYFDQGLFDKALEVYKGSIASDPYNAGAYAGLADCYRKQGKIEEAIQSFKKSTEVNPGYTTAYINLGNTEFFCQIDLKRAACLPSGRHDYF